MLSSMWVIESLHINKRRNVCTDDYVNHRISERTLRFLVFRGACSFQNHLKLTSLCGVCRIWCVVMSALAWIYFHKPNRFKMILYATLAFFCGLPTVRQFLNSSFLVATTRRRGVYFLPPNTWHCWRKPDALKRGLKSSKKTRWT